MSEKIGVMLCGHGSRDVDAIREFQALAGHLAQRLPQYEVDSGFLEFAKPIIRTGLDALKAKGVSRILAVPGMLFAAGHVKNDLPWEINSFAAENPGLPITFGRELAIDTKLLAAARARIEEAEAASPAGIERKDTLLLVVGRGTNDPDANSNIAKVARMLWEGMGFGWAEIAFSGVAYPLVDQALERVARLGFKRVVVFPYFLFTGILVKRIYEWTDQAAAAHPGIEFVKAPLPQRPSPGGRQLHRAGGRDPRRFAGHELQLVQIPRAGGGLRGLGGRRPGRPSPSCARHRHRRGSSRPRASS